ncbi:AMIN-like domain-containing (lipo)protein [Nonomuraea jiangxiensis]|uniref:AMIN-like domain-containing protein n=1 Tax=Nonomuraea jiangxiensis TaxID=633440 RepID=A0A1G8FR99_9ACTN|nr:hypothetical protein [Nonomuraea jiangxiensis]SDH84631.1 hypothetical protein SAMN05421869_103401 [Nonomuraea jiangxiensis]
MRSRAAVPLACVAAVLTACGTAPQTVQPERPPVGTPSAGGPSTGGSSLESPSGGGPDVGAPPDAGLDTEGSTSSSEVHVDNGGGEPALVTAVRYAAHQGYDRVVVDLRGGSPGYDVTWVDKLVQDGSGKRIDVRGGAYLQLTLFPAHAHDEDGRSTWTGGPVYRAGLRNLTDVVRTGDFEGRVGIALVLNRQSGFQVIQRGDRLILDVAH